MKRVLMVTAAWPPVARVGVRRPLRLARRLSRLGWAPSVLTPDPESIFRRMPALDDTLHVPDIPVIKVPAIIASTRIARLVARLPEKWAYPINRIIEDSLVPDQYPEWSRAACRAAETLDGIDLVWVTGGPFGIFLAGAKIARHLAVPLVLDYRDPWTVADIPRRTILGPSPTRLAQLEKSILDQATGVAYVNQDMYDLNAAHFGSPSDGIWTVIPNGFAPEDVPDVMPHDFGRPTLIYAGACYASRSMKPVLKGMHAAISQGLPCPQLKVFGELDPDALSFLEAHPLQGHLAVSGRVSAVELNAYVQGADGLLLLIGPGHRTALSGKVFDYLQARRPIFGVGPTNCAAADLIQRAGVGHWAEQIDDIVALLGIVATNGLSYAPVETEIQPYSADRMAEKTAALLDECLAHFQDSSAHFQDSSRSFKRR